MRGARTGVGLLVVALLLTACSGQSDIRRFIADTYRETSSSRDTATFSSDDPVGTTVTRIVGKKQPEARQADGGSEYLRYDRDIVIVSAAPGGSSIRVEDLGGGYSGGAFVFLGPGFNPGSPSGGVRGGGGGPGSVK